MIIRCLRGAANKPAGTAIVSPLTPNTPVLKEIGRQAIDLASPLTAVNQESIYRANAAVGQLAQVYDALHGKPWKGLCISVQHGMDNNGALRTQTRFLK